MSSEGLWESGEVSVGGLWVCGRVVRVWGRVVRVCVGEW